MPTTPVPQIQQQQQQFAQPHQVQQRQPLTLSPRPSAPAHPIPGSFAKSASSAPVVPPMNPDQQFAAPQVPPVMMPSPAAAGASSSVPANTDDFAPAVSAMMALMDESPQTPQVDPPQTPEHHRAEEDHPEEEEAQHPAICCICHDVLIQNGMEVEALPCGHMFHSECLTQCRDVVVLLEHRAHSSAMIPPLPLEMFLLRMMTPGRSFEFCWSSQVCEPPQVYHWKFAMGLVVFNQIAG